MNLQCQLTCANGRNYQREARELGVNPSNLTGPLQGWMLRSKLFTLSKYLQGNLYVISLSVSTRQRAQFFPNME